MLSPKLLIGVVIGFLVCHYMWKRKQGEEIDAKLDEYKSKIKSNISDWLNNQEVTSTVDSEKVAEHLVNEVPQVIEANNYSGLTSPKRIALS